MKGMFTVLGLLLVVAIVGILAKKQFGDMGRASAPASAASSPATGGIAPPTGTPQQQVRQVEQAVQGMMQQPRPMPEDK
jgi:hypothetical protein